MMTLSSVPASLSTAHVSTSSPRVVLHPVMQHKPITIGVKEPNCHQCFNKRAISAGPICCQFNVFNRHAGQVAVAAIRCGPQDQANKIPRGSLPQSLNQLLGFRVRWEAHRDTGISCHQTPTQPGRTERFDVARENIPARLM